MIRPLIMQLCAGFGELILGDKQNLQLIPPRNGISYILSYSDPETILAKLDSDQKKFG